MRGIHYIIMLVGGMLAACTHQMDGQDGETVCFSLSRTETAPATHLQTRLYVAQRAQETQTEDYTDLYCGAKDRYFLNNAQTFTVKQLQLQWYKFCFIGVPDYEGIIDGKEMFTDMTAAPNTEDKETHDFTRLKVDVTPIKDFLDKDQDAAKHYDLNIYRGTVNRWTKRPEAEGKVANETVMMRRINGQLDIVMGKLTDQFAYPVQSITVAFLDMAGRVYVHDNAVGEGMEEVIVDKESLADWTYTYTVSEAERTGTESCVITLPLLPQRLLGASLRVTVMKAEVPKIYSFPIRAVDGQLVSIKKNTRTKLLFNGMFPGQFEVYYAGIDGSGIDVDNDNWTGWE